ncbi:MAG: DUF1003 domain-containing protein [Armatimonadetes bacterium]|nr:DUF1003 domain-containing protein [Armatimonadota bacterium]
MARQQPEKVVCHICKQQKALTEMVPGSLVHGAVADAIRKRHPDWSSDGYICLTDLNHFRSEYFTGILEEERGELTSLEAEVVRSLREQELLSRNLNVEFDREATLGGRVADTVARFGGSWAFISIFVAVLVAWIALNTVGLFRRPFDPFPFIFLNLVLSCVAAIQAPVIMMSQNRQEAKDRLRAEHDYRVNLKAELEIRHLHGKLDVLLTHQWQRLLEIQQMQVELMEEISQRLSGQPGR